MNRSSEKTLLQIGRLLRSKRRHMGLSQQDMSLKTGVRRQTIADLEHGRNVGSHLLCSVIDLLGLKLTVSPNPAGNRQCKNSGTENPSRFVQHLRMAFDFPYDWSNGDGMPDATLIAKVLRGQRFMDIARLCKHFGIDRIENQLASPAYNDIRPKLKRTLHTIRSALNS